jgi:hypothetical protein
MGHQTQRQQRTPVRFGGGALDKRVVHRIKRAAANTLNRCSAAHRVRGAKAERAMLCSPARARRLKQFRRGQSVPQCHQFVGETAIDRTQRINGTQTVA